MLPALYHAHHSCHTTDLPFWLELAAQSPGPILELGCGSGRVLSPLVQAGYVVYGLDNDWGMLAFLRSHLAPGLKERGSIFQADFTRFHLAEKFGLILLPCNTYSTLSSDQRLALLRCARRHLGPGGVFAASLPNPYLLNHLPGYADEEVEQIFSHPIDGEPVQVSSSWERDHEALNVYWHYDHLHPDGTTHRQSVRMRHILTSTQTYKEEIYSAGFEKLSLFGDFDRSKYGRFSNYLIFLAR